MSVDGPGVQQQPAPARSQIALAQYNARIRPWRIAYAVAITAVVIIALVVVKVAYSHGEISHAKLATAAAAAPSVPLTGPGATLTRAWASSDHTAIGTPYWGGTLVTYSAHTVYGRDALTGAARWSYTRDDRTVCTAAQMGGVTVAVFELHGNCDELTELDSGTGARKWTRTVDEDGNEIHGRPAFSVGQYTLMLTTRDVVYAIDPGTGYNRWLFSQAGCTINSAVLGSAGVLISQDCTAPDCTGKQFCGKGEQLLLRDASAGTADDGKNRDQIKWNLIGNTSTPVSADAVISSVQPGSRRLTVLDPTKGKTVHTLALNSPAAGPSTAVQTARAELIHTGGITYSVETSGADFFWRTPTTTLPTVTATDGANPPDLSHAIVAVAGAQGIDLLDTGDGSVSRTVPAAAPSAGSLAYPFGTGFILAGAHTTVYR